MNLDIVLIDVLRPDGVLTSYKVRPTTGPRGLTMDRLRDIHPDRFGDADLDIGGTRIYNASRCSIDKSASKLRAFELGEDRHSFRFQFEHTGIPLGPSRQAHGGAYNLVLPPGWRCRSLFFSDPHDRRHEDVSRKKRFQFSVIWDPECSTQLAEMMMRSSRGSFSFVVAGTASLVAADASDTRYVEARESQYSVAELSDSLLIDGDGRNRLALELADKSDWLELKPNFFGIGVNLNEVVKDAIQFFRKKVTERRS
ncbi:MAG TPA: hypothetical protein PLZ39_17705 [Verrucomicrobiota bacterium]|jgi:hypothetical protein|nr:hypothetical protein [Verrucomicrobiota bacterium]